MHTQTQSQLPQVKGKKHWDGTRFRGGTWAGQEKEEMRLLSDKKTLDVSIKYVLN